jgi:hypothetical protein
MAAEVFGRRLGGEGKKGFCGVVALAGDGPEQRPGDWDKMRGSASHATISSRTVRDPAQ